MDPNTKDRSPLPGTHSASAAVNLLLLYHLMSLHTIRRGFVAFVPSRTNTLRRAKHTCHPRERMQCARVCAHAALALHAIVCLEAIE